MANNGVSHLVASDELMALEYALDWLAFTPAQRGHLVPVLYRPVPIHRFYSSAARTSRWYPAQTDAEYSPFDPVDRTVDYVPSRERQNDDPRWMFTGVLASQVQLCNDSSSSSKRVNHSSKMDSTKSDCWLSGFFDWGTWHETLMAWAAGVVVGRARLGGIPCGAITAETRSVVCRVPADPANLSSEAQVVNQAGQVWYPDSAYKTAQAIEDLAREHLPLFIFASWRGFSGGMKDMYDQVLKFGSMIIDAIRRYPEPVFVYLPPHSQLRGGAWVVVDPAINPDRIEFYADPVSCRAGVLEPEGTVEIKYRRADITKTMHRLDGRCRQLLEKIDRLQLGGPGSEDSSLSVKDQIFQLKAELESRQKELHPFYHQVACTFADLHDTPGRLRSRGLVHGLVEWSKSRTFFFGRLRRKLLELKAIRSITASCDLTGNLPEEDKPLADYFRNLLSTLNHPNGNTLGPVGQDQWVANTGQHDGHLAAPHIRFPLDPLRLLLPECPPPSPDTPVRARNESAEIKTLISNNKIAEEVAKSVPEVAVRYTPSYAYGLSLLQSWFIEDFLSKVTHRVGEHNTPHGDRGASNSVSQSDPDTTDDVGQRVVTGQPSRRKSRKSSGAKANTKSVPVIETLEITNEQPESSPACLEEASCLWKNDIAVGDWLSRQMGVVSFQHIPLMETSTPHLAANNDKVATEEKVSVCTKIETLKRDLMLQHLRRFLYESSLATDQLGEFLSQSLDDEQRQRLVHILSQAKSVGNHEDVISL